MRFSLRAASSAFSASSRTDSNVCQSLSIAATSKPAGSSPVRSFGSREELEVHALGAARSRGRYPQTSSAVKLMTGASSRTSASPSRHSAVCAERRASDFGAEVYSRSFSTSK